ncbi:hypothetical protein, partial [Segatella hominis]|uniref:hypothetical protein n=1 Tax=Segatella hominis TaxID=2518605 RepID=UPI003AB93856
FISFFIIVMFYEFYGCKNTVFLLKCKIFSAKLNFKFCAQCAAENIQGIKSKPKSVCSRGYSQGECGCKE